MRLETDDPEVFEQWMRFAKAQMPFPLFGKDWLVQRYSAAPRNVPGVRFRCELQEVKRVPAALKVGSRVRVVKLPPYMSWLRIGDLGAVEKVCEHVRVCFDRFGSCDVVPVDCIEIVEEIAPLGFGDADLAKATDDAVMRPLPPPKPPVAELSGPVKHAAAAMPAKALKR